MSNIRLRLHSLSLPGLDLKTDHKTTITSLGKYPATGM